MRQDGVLTPPKNRMTAATTPTTTGQTEIAANLWQHQEDAVEFAMDRKATLWHMGLGTGKSLCAITLAARKQAKAILILCPLSVCDAWREQHQRFRPNVQMAILNRRSVKRKLEEAERIKQRAKSFAQPFVVVVNYESARSAPLAPWLEKQKFDLLVLDEIHKTKSHKGSTSKWVARLTKTCGQRVGLTGTPMPHSPMDIFAQFRALGSPILGNSFWRFRQRYAVMGGYQGKNVVAYKSLDELQERMSRITFQASRDVLDLPDAIHERRVVDLGTKARRAYDDLDHDFRAGVAGGEIVATNALVKLLRLQQLTSGTASVVDDDSDSGTRHELVDDAKETALGLAPSRRARRCVRTVQGMPRRRPPSSNDRWSRIPRTIRVAQGTGRVATRERPGAGRTDPGWRNRH